MGFDDNNQRAAPVRRASAASRKFVTRARKHAAQDVSGRRDGHACEFDRPTIGTHLSDAHEAGHRSQLASPELQASAPYARDGIQEVRGYISEAKASVSYSQAHQGTPPNSHIPKVALQTRHALRLVSVAHITRFHSGNGVTQFQAHGCTQEIELTLDALEKRLRPYGFHRTHRSELINIASVMEITRRNGCGGTVRLCDGQVAVVSKRNYNAFIARLNLVGG